MLSKPLFHAISALLQLVLQLFKEKEGHLEFPKLTIEEFSKMV